MSLSKEDLKILSAPFDEKTLGVKVESLSKDRTKAMLICYLQHTDVYTRLEEVCPSWECALMNEQWGKDPKGNDVCSIRVRMTLLDVSRENIGEGYNQKSAMSDALKRAAMLFGVGRYLYDAETVWVPYNELTDKYKVYTYEDYKKHLKQPLKVSEKPGSVPIKPVDKSWGQAKPTSIRASTKVSHVMEEEDVDLPKLDTSQLGHGFSAD